MCEVTLPGWLASTPTVGCQALTLPANGSLTLDFGNLPLPCDVVNCLLPPRCTVGWWPFDECTGTNLSKDISGNNSVTLNTPATSIVDGNAVATFTGPAVRDGSVSNSGPLRFGQHCPGFGPATPFAGIIDEVEMFNCCLPVSTLKQLTAATNGKCQLSAGEHAIRRDGTDELGAPVSGRIYLVRLRSAEGKRVVKVVRLR